MNDTKQKDWERENKNTWVKKWQEKYEVHPNDLEDIYDDLVSTLKTDVEAFDNYKGKLWSTAIQKCWEAPFPLVAMQYLLQRVLTQQKKEIVEMIEKEDNKWNGSGEHYANVREALNNLLLTLSSIKENK